MAAVINKLKLLKALSSWKNLNYLKHKHKEMKLENLIMRLKFKDENCVSEKVEMNHSIESKANVVDHNTKNKKRKHPCQGSNRVPKAVTKNFKGIFKVCDIPRHKKKYKKNLKN